MKIRKITLQNYKRFVKPQTFSFTNPDGEINEKTLFVGDNGTGKSSILQAIVALVASATREKFKPQDLDWSGYDFRHLQTGKLPLKVEVEIEFGETEIIATQEYAEKLKEMDIKLGKAPENYQNVILSLDFHTKKVNAKKGLGAFNQFSGYQYAKRLATLTSDKNTLFEKVGNIYWYTEQRNINHITNFLEKKGNKLVQLDDIRKMLASAENYHLGVVRGKRKIQEGEFDFYDKLQNLYAKVFSERSFIGTAPRFDIYEEAKAPDFFLSDGKNQYELAGMSAGERAIFPILMDFTRWNINNSIIIMDEIELHLHPPLQQKLVRVLSQLGKNNQFIFTTHSNTITSMFDESENQIIRLPNE